MNCMYNSCHCTGEQSKFWVDPARKLIPDMTQIRRRDWFHSRVIALKFLICFVMRMYGFLKCHRRINYVDDERTILISLSAFEGTALI